jgi:cytochrome c oxidase cbb3-type subunit III
MNRKKRCQFRGRGLPVLIALFYAAPAFPQALQGHETSKSSQAGQQLFSSRCAGCHGLDGRGGEHAPNIATSSNVQELPDAALLRIVRNGIPAGGMPAFGPSFDDAQLNAVVHYLHALQGQERAVSIPGKPEEGRALFFGSAQCSKCHMVGGQGGFIGADLSGYGKTHSAGEIREAITSPNKNLDPRRGTVVAHTRDGHTYTGIARNEDNFSLQMQTLDGTFHLFDKAELARVEHQPRSLMPSQYGATLSANDLDDLVSYLMTAAAHQTGGIHKDGEDE